MTANQKKVQDSLKWKTSNSRAAAKLGMPLDVYLNIKRGLQSKTTTAEGPTKSSIKYDLEKGTGVLQMESSVPLSPEEIAEKFKVDAKTWKLSGYWNKEQPNGKYLVSAQIRQIQQEEVKAEAFMEFLKTYKPEVKLVMKESLNIPGRGIASLIINKQDFHANKWDSDGNNDIYTRFSNYADALEKTLYRATLGHNLKDIVYIIGSDHFNSEVTNSTVKGTPQTNILTYHEAFKEICDHEVAMIQRLLISAERVRVYYLVGNHDATVSYHMVEWLKAYFRKVDRVYIDTDVNFTKYFSLHDTAVCINHGDVQKPERLAQNFPIEYKQGFAEAENAIILTGDRHFELTRDIGGVTFYQIPALSTAKGNWDKQCGYTTTKAKMTSFLIEPFEGVSDVIKVRMN